MSAYALPFPDVPPGSLMSDGEINRRPREWLTGGMLVRLLDLISTIDETPDVPLGFDPDDYPITNGFSEQDEQP